MDVCLCVCACVRACVCARAFFCVCVQVEALRRADHPPKESYRLFKLKKKTPWLVLRKRTIPTERSPLVSEVSANFFADRGCRVISATDPRGR
jgi:hypothetical protein